MRLCVEPSSQHHQHLATHSAAAAAAAPRQHQSPELLTLRDRTGLEDLFRALQTQDSILLHKAFIEWTSVLADPSSPFHDAAVRQAQELSGPSFSEILRSLDPMASEKHDVAHGLNLTPGHTQFTNASALVDEFGVRRRHRQLLRGMQALMQARSESRHSLTTADYEVLIRCAGISVDLLAAKRFWNAMAGQGLQESRTAKTWTEFIKSRFMTEPAYYQFDRSRVAVMARDLYSNRETLPSANLKRMDNMRLSINALKMEPWNRRVDEPDEDLRRVFRRKTDFRSYRAHWIRGLYYGHEIDTELLSVSLIAFARSSSLRSIKEFIFKSYYGIHIDEQSVPGRIEISGGIDLPADSPIRPNERFLSAIVDALGSMSHIALGMKLLDFVSRRYDVPIPRETWSNLLNWTYLCASKPFKPLRRLHGDFPSTATSAADVRLVWDVMTSEPYNIAPTFEDYDIYIKTLISQRAFGRALGLIRGHILPAYEHVVQEHQLAVQDEVLQNGIAPSGTATQQAARLEAQTYKEYLHHHISSWFDRLLKTASANKGHREGDVMKTMIPNLVVEFGDFFHHQIQYRTAQGVVRIHRPEAFRRFEWKARWRKTLPQKKAGIHAYRVEGSDQPDFAYPLVPTMKIFEWRRQAKPRMEHLGKAPEEAKGKKKEAPHEWWDRLEDELML